MSEDRDAAIERLREKHQLYKRFFDSEDGAEVLADLERDCYFKTTTFSTDMAQLAYREGMRCIVLHIKTMLELDPEAMKDAIQKQEATGLDVGEQA